MKETITFGSVCSGIEAASVAWNPLGWKAAWLSEIEPFPCAVLQHHYPDVPNLGDMTKIAHLIRDGFVPAPDVFCGGTPCQAFSVAGLRNSLDDARGNLSLTFCEIANEIDTRRAAAGLLPSVIFWENVPGVLSTKDNAFGCFLGALAGEDGALEPPGGKWQNAGCVLGPQRTVAWRVLDAQYFGVAQRRRRVFVVASARAGFDPTEVLFEFDGMRRDSPPSREAGEAVAPCVTAGASNGGAAHGARSGSAKDNLIVPVAFGGNNQSGPIDVATARNACGSGSGSGRLDFETETFLVQPIAFSSKDYGGDAEIDLSPTLRAGGHHASHANAGVPPAIAFSAADYKEGTFEQVDTARALTTSADRSRAAPVVCVTGEITHTLKAEGFDASEDGTGRGQPLVPVLQYQHHCPCGRSFFGQMDARCPSCGGGNSIVEGQSREVLQPIVAAVALRGREGGATAELGDDLAGCLRASGGGGDKPHALVGMAVRRLTPVECERLQGFPGGYTFIPTWSGWRPMDASETPESCIAAGLEVRQNKKTGKWRVKDVDGPRYKALGNSWAVPNVRWIGARIDRHLRATSGAIPETNIEKATV